MKQSDWSLETIQLPLRYTWKISRNATDEKVNLLVSFRHNGTSGRGEAAPNIRYGETPELLHEQFRKFVTSAPDSFNDTAELQAHCEAEGLSFALRFAIESAWQHATCRNSRTELLKHLEVPLADKVPTAYTIPIMDPGQLKAFYSDQQLERFKYVKLKVNTELAEDLVRQLCGFSNQRVLLDANEAFTDVEECIRFLERIRKLPLELVEQPLPSSMEDEARYLKNYCPFPLFADEAITHDTDVARLKDSYDGVNMKLMKAGGYETGLHILRAAKKLGMQTMIGCMVETSLGISSAMHLCGLADYADLDSFLLLKSEPFGLLKEENGLLSYTEADKIS